MTLSLRTTIVLPKNVPESDPTSARYPSLNYSTSKTEWASVTSNLTSFWRRHRVGTGRESLTVCHFGMGRFSALFWLVFQNFSFGSAAFDCFFFYYNLITHPPATVLSFSKLRESTPGVEVLTRSQVDYAVRAPSRFFSKFQFIPLFQSRLKRSNKGFNLHSVHLKIIESFVDEQIFVFVREGVCQ